MDSGLWVSDCKILNLIARDVSLALQYVTFVDAM